MKKQKIINTDFSFTPKEHVFVSPFTGEIVTRPDEGYAAALTVSRVGHEIDKIINFPFYADSPKEAVETGIAMLEDIKNDIDIGIETLKKFIKEAEK